MNHALLAVLCGATLALLPLATADPLDPEEGCLKVLCPHLHLFAVCGGNPPDTLPGVIIGNDTSDCR